MNKKTVKRISIFGVIALILGLSIQAGPWLSSDTSKVAVSIQAEDKVDDAAKIEVVEAYGKTPMGFEENLGQTDQQVKFMTRGLGYSLFLTPTEAVLSLSKQPAKLKQDGLGMNKPEDIQKLAKATTSRALRMRMVGANPSPVMAGVDMQSGKGNYIRGNDQSQWKTGIRRYSRVHYKEVYEGIDLAFYGNQKQLEYDFIVKPGASSDAIRLAFVGADSKEIDAEGNLILYLGSEQVIQHAPITYQIINGKRQMIDSKYVLADDGVAFKVASYDAGRDLIIDPVLVYSTYLGGNVFDIPISIAVDTSGNAYVAGYTQSTNFPTLNAFQATKGSASYTGFVTKMDSTGALAYSTYLGGNVYDLPISIAVDTSGNAYVAGYTYSTNSLP